MVVSEGDEFMAEQGCADSVRLRLKSAPMSRVRFMRCPVAYAESSGRRGDIIMVNRASLIDKYRVFNGS